MEFDSLEMDRFTLPPLAQEIIELIVRVRESTSDIEFITEETDQVSVPTGNEPAPRRTDAIAWYPLLRSPNGCLAPCETFLLSMQAGSATD